MTVPISVIGLMSAAAGCIGNADSVNDELIEFNESLVLTATVIGGAMASRCRTAALVEVSRPQPVHLLSLASVTLLS